jgi:integrase
MPKIQENLSIVQINKIKWDGSRIRKAVGGGLYILVDQYRRSWVVRTGTIKRSWKVIGNCEEVSLADARKAVPEALDSAPKSAHLPTFKEAARSYIEAQEKVWRNNKGSKQWTNTLNTYAMKDIGNIPVDLITPKDVIRALDNCQHLHETLRRVRGRIYTIIESSWAINRPGALYANPADSSIIKYAIPKVARLPDVKHFIAVPVKAAPLVFESVLAKAKKEVGYAALAFCILTASRSVEARAARFDQIKDGVWMLPKDKMKAGRAHDVPLSRLALEIIRIRTMLDPDSPYIFPSPVKGVPMSDNALSKALKSAARAAGSRRASTYTVHGMRSTFTDWGTLNGKNLMALDLCLAHNVGDKTQKAYRRTLMPEERAKILEEWAIYLRSSKKAK